MNFSGWLFAQIKHGGGGGDGVLLLKEDGKRILGDN